MTTVNAKTRAVDSIEDAQRALERALTELDAIPSFDPALVGFVAHALNSYVNAMTATTELLQQALRDSADGDVKVWLEGIRHATDLMHHTIGRLLHSSSPNDFPLKPTYVNLPVMMDRASRYYRRLAQPHRVEIVCHADADVPLVWADRVAVAVVVDNLLSNALRVSPPASTISIDITSEQSAVICSVTDAGGGLSTDQQVRLSEQMTAGATDGSHPADGYEVAVAWEFVDRMGGRLWFESEPGRGTRFLLRLPART